MVVEEPARAKVMALESITVLPDCGHEFVLDLKDSRRIKGMLRVETGKDAHEKVVKLINESIQPEVVLYEHQKEAKVWVVDIRLRHKECVGDSCTLRELSLTEWLVREGLAWKA
jgi:hypothetical protein